MKRFFRYICLILIAVILLSIPSFAAEQRASSYIMRTTAYLNPVSDIEFRVWHEVIAIGIMDELGASEVKVQESTDGTNWTTVRLYNCIGWPALVAENTAAHT